MDTIQSRRFHRQGYLKVQRIIPLEMVEAAKKIIFSRIGALRASAGASVKSGNVEALAEPSRLMGSAGGEEIFLDLFNKTGLKKIVERGIGHRVLPPHSAQLATLFPGVPDGATNEYGFLDRETPHYGWTGHLDGLWNGGTPVPKVGSRLQGAKLKAWNANPSTNGVFKENPEFNANIMNFTALVGVALSDQSSLGSGNLGVLRGGHHHMERFFRDQMTKGGPLGPDGPGWERENRKAPNRRGLIHYPRAVRDKYAKKAFRSSDGETWPEPDFLRLKPGDAVIVHSLTPHGGSRVEGPEPRLMVYFRCVSSNRPEANLSVYPRALCDRLLEWQGVKRQLAN